MNSASGISRAITLGFFLLLVSCSAPRHTETGAPAPQELARYAIVFEQQPDGHIAHAWIPLKEFHLANLPHFLGTPSQRRNIVRVSSGLSAYCDGRYDQCERDCLSSSKPFVIGHRKYMDTRTQPWRIARSWWCERNCLEARAECNKGRGEWAEQYIAEFDGIDPAIDWIKKHREELAVGAVVVIAGVAFAVVVAGSGGVALALAPLLIVADVLPNNSEELQLARGCYDHL